MSLSRNCLISFSSLCVITTFIQMWYLFYKLCVHGMTLYGIEFNVQHYITLHYVARTNHNP